LSDKPDDGLVVTDRSSEIAVENALPVAEVLLAERGVESIGMARGGDVCGWSAFSEHLLDGISGDEVDEEKDKADHQPDHGQGVEDALEERFQWSVPSCQYSVVTLQDPAIFLILEVCELSRNTGKKRLHLITHDSLQGFYEGYLLPVKIAIF
jgi:hypothetical protein